MDFSTIDKRIQMPTGPISFEVQLALTGSNIIMQDNNKNFRIKNIYNLSIFEIMKIVNERIKE